MRRLALRVATLAVAAAVALLVALATLPFDRETIVQAFLLAIGSLVLLSFVLWTRGSGGAGPSSFERALEPRAAAPERPAELARMEREVVLGVGNAFYLHYRLRPTLREVAAYRLRERRALELDTGDDDVRAALGDGGWELLRPDRQAPWDRTAPGLPLGHLSRLVSAIERI